MTAVTLDVGIDLDGVGYDFAYDLHCWIERNRLISKFRTPRPYNPPTVWEFHSGWGLTRAKFHRLCSDAVDAGFMFRYGTPTEGFVEALAELRAKGHRVHIITARNFGGIGASRRNTRGWLLEHGVEYDSLTFTSKKSSVRTDIMIEDYAPNFFDLKRAGTVAVLMTQEWNKSFSNLDRVSTMSEFVGVVDALAKSREAPTQKPTPIKKAAAKKTPAKKAA